ncbi:MAG: DUF7470 family protein [Halobacteriota archaeon]
MNVLETIGYAGLAGIGLIVFGIALVSVQDPIIGAGVMLAIAGIALVARGVATSVMTLFGMT